MKAVAVFLQTKEVKLIDAPEPRLLHPTQAKIRMREVGVCGTDRDIWEFKYGEPPAGEPYLITGHESLGQVTDVGSRVTKVKAGDWVVLTVRRSCPENCSPCAAGRADFCLTGHYTERGIKRAHGYMAEFVVEEERYLSVVPPPLQEVAVLLEPLTIIEKALLELSVIQNRLPAACRIGPGLPETSRHRALVLGAGPVGCLAAMAFRNLGLQTYVTARHPAPNPKAQLITELGAAYLATSEKPPPQIAAQIGNIDLILEATGSPTAGFEFLPLLGVNGIFIFTGVPGPTKDLELDAGALMRRLVLDNQVVLGTVNAPKQAFDDGLRDLSAFLQRWPRTLRSLITRRVPVDRFAEILGEVDSAEIKTVLTF